MTIQQEWQDFLEQLFNQAVELYKDTPESTYLKEKRSQLDARMAELALESKFVDDYIFEIGLDNDRKAEFIYRQGMKDCVWLLRTLEVL